MAADMKLQSRQKKYNSAKKITGYENIASNQHFKNIFSAQHKTLLRSVLLKIFQKPLIMPFEANVAALFLFLVYCEMS